MNSAQSVPSLSTCLSSSQVMGSPWDVWVAFRKVQQQLKIFCAASPAGHCRPTVRLPFTPPWLQLLFRQYVSFFFGQLPPERPVSCPRRLHGAYRSSHRPSAQQQRAVFAKRLLGRQFFLPNVALPVTTHLEQEMGVLNAQSPAESARHVTGPTRQSIVAVQRYHNRPPPSARPGYRFSSMSWLEIRLANVGQRPGRQWRILRGMVFCALWVLKK